MTCCRFLAADRLARQPAPGKEQQQPGSRAINKSGSDTRPCPPGERFSAIEFADSFRIPVANGTMLACRKDHVP